MGEERKNGNTVLLTVIGVATLLVALVGATFAYFTATVNTSGNKDIQVQTTQVAGLTMTSTASTVGVPVYPGWVGYQTIDIQATGDAGKAKYKLELNFEDNNSSSATTYTALLGDLKYAVCGAKDQASAFTIGASQFTAASAQVSADGQQYSMTGGVVAFPTGCDQIIAEGTVSTTGLHEIENNIEIEHGKYNRYFVMYDFENKEDSQNAAMGASFKATPKLTVLATVGQ